MTAGVNWDRLADRTKSFDVLEAPVDPGGKVADVVAVGLRLKLSELTARFPSTGGNSLTVYADTLVVDTADLAVKSLVVVARVLDTTALKGAPLTAPATAAEFLVANGKLALTSPNDTTKTPTATIVTGIEPLTATTITGPTLETSTAIDDASISDLTGRPYALNALRATFAAATWLLNSPNQADQATARDMLAWVAVATGPAAATTATSPTEWSDLHHVATPLLLAANVAPGATYVPALSTNFYDTQISKLLDTLDAYDQQLNTLTTATNLDQTLAAVAKTLTATATTELVPLQTQLATLNRNINDLNVGINTLNYQFAQQTSTIDTAWADLKVALTDKQISDWFNACIKMAVDAIGLSLDAANIYNSAKKKPDTPKKDGGDDDDAVASDSDDDSSSSSSEDEDRRRSFGCPIQDTGSPTGGISLPTPTTTMEQACFRLRRGRWSSAATTTSSRSTPTTTRPARSPTS